MLEDKNINKRLGNNIKIKRKILGLSQNDLAQDIGVSYQQLQKYEAGKSSLNMNMLQNICNAMQVDAAKIVYEAQTSSGEADKPNSAREQILNDKARLERIAHNFALIEDEDFKEKIEVLINSAMLVSRSVQREDS